jgi:hypothetical protein
MHAMLLQALLLLLSHSLLNHLHKSHFRYHQEASFSFLSSCAIYSFIYNNTFCTFDILKLFADSVLYT